MQTATAAPAQTYVTLAPGDPAPWFHQRSASNPRYAFDTAAGRTIVLCFFASAAEPEGRGALDAVCDDFGYARAAHLVLLKTCMRPPMPGLRFFWDFDGTI